MIKFTNFSTIVDESIAAQHLELLYEKFKSEFSTDPTDQTDFQPTVNMFAELDPALKEHLEMIGKQWNEIYDNAYFLNEKTY